MVIFHSYVSLPEGVYIYIYSVYIYIWICIILFHPHEGWLSLYHHCSGVRPSTHHVTGWKFHWRRTPPIWISNPHSFIRLKSKPYSTHILVHFYCKSSFQMLKSRFWHNLAWLNFHFPSYFLVKPPFSLMFFWWNVHLSSFFLVKPTCSIIFR